MALPRKLKYLNLFIDGNNWQGIVETFTLPKLARKLENYRGGGMNGSVGVDLGMDDGALDVEWTIGGMESLVFRQMGMAKIDGVALRYAGSIQRDDTAEIQAVEVIIRGRHKELDSGEHKQGDNSTTKISTAVTYFKLTIAGEEICEIDLVNMIEVIDGEDRLEEHRQAIGL